MQTTVSFNSMLFHGDGLQLASIRAVPGTPSTASWALIPSAPVPGEIGSRPVMLLPRRQGGDELEVGNTRLRVAGELGQEPDQGWPFQTAPRGPDPQRRCGGTGALLPGSRQQWRYLIRAPGRDRPL